MSKNLCLESPGFLDAVNYTELTRDVSRTVTGELKLFRVSQRELLLFSNPIWGMNKKGLKSSNTVQLLRQYKPFGPNGTRKLENPK